MNEVKFYNQFTGETTKEDLDAIHKHIAEMEKLLNEKLIKEGYVRFPEPPELLLSLTIEEIYKFIIGQDYENPALRNVGWVKDIDELKNFKLNLELETSLNEEKEPVIMLNFKEEPDWLK